MGLSNQSNQELYDPLRSKRVKARPEEIVRQSLLYQMTHQLKYPKELIAVEKELKDIPHLANKSGQLPRRRVDIICFAKNIHPDFSLFPLLVIECKAEKADQEALQQVLGYNHYVQAPFIAVVSVQDCLFAYPDGSAAHYKFLSYLPPYPQLLQWAGR